MVHSSRTRRLAPAGLAVLLCGAMLLPASAADARKKKSRERPTTSWEFADGGAWGAYCCTRSRNGRCTRTSDRCCLDLQGQCDSQCPKEKDAPIGEMCDRNCYDAVTTCQSYRGPVKALGESDSELPRGPSANEVKESEPAPPEVKQTPPTIRRPILERRQQDAPVVK